MYTFHTLENRNYLRAFTQVFNAISSILESQPRLVLYSSLTHSAFPPLSSSTSPSPLHLLSNCLTFEVNQIVCFFRLLSVCPLPFPFPFSFYFLYISISILLLQPLALYALLLLHSGRNFVGNKSPKVDIKSFCFPFFFLFAFLWSFLLFGFSFILFSFQFVALFSHWLSHNRRQAGHIAHVSGLRRLKRGVRREVEKQQRRGHLFSVVLSHR